MYLILLVFFLSGSATAAMFPGQDLIDSFGSTCTSTSGWTDMALSDSRALMHSLESLKNDPDCQNAYSALSQLSGLENRLISLNAEFSDKIEIAKLEGQEMELMAQIASTSNQQTIAEIEVALRQIQLDKAGFIATDNAKNKYDSEKLKSLYTQIIYSTDSTYNVIAANQKCLDKNPGILTAATSLSGSLASSAMLVNPALGLGMGAMSEFINQTVTHFRNKGYNRRVRYIADPTTVFHGFKCAMETLSNRYCGIDDALTFLKLEDTIKQDPNIQSEMYEISEVYDRDLPILMDWLEKVKAGAPAANTSDAERLGKLFDKEANLKKTRVYGQGIFAQQEPIYYNPVNSEFAKFNILKNIVIEITKKAYGSTYSGSDLLTPLSDVYSAEEAPYRLLGFAGQPRGENGDIIHITQFQFSDWVPKPNFETKYQEVLKEFEVLIEKAQGRYNQEFTLFLQPDPKMTIASYSERTNNLWKRSPKNALLNILSFIKDNVPEEIEDSGFGDIYESTIEKLEKIDDALSGKLSINFCENRVKLSLPINFTETRESSCQDEKKVIEFVFNTAKLEFGTIVFQNRVESIIRVAIDKYIQNSQQRDRNHIAQLLAANSYLDVLKKVQGTENKTLIKNNLEEAKSVAYTNMKQFADTFGSHINAVLKTMSADVRHTDTDISGPAIKTRAKFCFLLAALPEWPREVWRAHCMGYRLEAMYRDGPETSSISEQLLNSRLKKRACLYRNYFRDSEIYRQWNIKI